MAFGRMGVRGSGFGGMGGGGGAKPQIVDLFMIAGQSNAEGRGNQLGTGQAGTGYYYNGSAFSALADSVGGATIGSAWPAFAKRWFELTGRKSVWIEQATGGSYAVAGQTPTWDIGTATLYPAAVTALNAAIVAVDLSPAFILNKVFICWAQGEAEADLIELTTITVQNAKDAITSIFGGFATDITQLDGIFVSELGRHKDNTSEVSYASYRAMQAEVCTELEKPVLVWTGAKSLLDNQMADNVHYGTSGLNAMGTGMVDGANAITITWLAGFENGLIPEVTSTNTSIATLSGVGPFTFSVNTGSKLSISGSTLKLAASLDHTVAKTHAFTISNAIGTTQAATAIVSFVGTDVEVKLTTTGAGQQWTVPAGVNYLKSVETIGAGATGGSAGIGSGSGGGAYSKIAAGDSFNNVLVTPGALIDYRVGAVAATEAATGEDSFFGATTLAGSRVGAKGGLGTASGTGGAGGAAASGIGTTKFSGGAGGDNGTNGGGGGGAGGPSGNGAVGQSSAAGSAGGAGDNGSGGAGGSGGAAPTSGGAGTEWGGGTWGSGGGSGGRTTSNGSATTGTGGLYGGGGGGARSGTSAQGAQGAIRIVYTT